MAKAKAPVMATKRQVTRLMKESADLWEALSEVLTAQNMIISRLLQSGGDDVCVSMTIEQTDALKKCRERLDAFDDQISPIFDDQI